MYKQSVYLFSGSTRSDNCSASFANSFVAAIRMHEYGVQLWYTGSNSLSGVQHMESSQKVLFFSKFCFYL